MTIQHHRYPWTPADVSLLVERKEAGERHKNIARELQRTPRAVDQMVANCKERGILRMHRNEELELLHKVMAESRLPDFGELG